MLCRARQRVLPQGAQIQFRVSSFEFRVNPKPGTRNSKRSVGGQSTLEYAVVIAVIAAALLGMQIYMKRGLQGRLRSSTDQIGDQYRPGNTTSSYTISTSRNSHDVLNTTGQSTSTLNADETQTKSGNETVTTTGENKLF